MTHNTAERALILASSSPHRRSLLERFGIPFEVIGPQVDESAGEGEPAHDLVARLAVNKAAEVARKFPDAVIIGSDQVALHGGRIVGKPGDERLAREQLRAFSGQTVRFYTSVAVLQAPSEVVGHAVVETRAEFRELGDAEIDRYVAAEHPVECAGSFRAESLGLCLFDAMYSQDPTAIIGLPLIETARLLRKAGFQLP